MSFLEVDECISLPLDNFDMENDNELLLNEIEFNEAKETAKPVESIVSASSTRHSTPIYQMLERVENKVKHWIAHLNLYLDF